MVVRTRQQKRSGSPPPTSATIDDSSATGSTNGETVAARKGSKRTNLDQFLVKTLLDDIESSGEYDDLDRI